VEAQDHPEYGQVSVCYLDTDLDLKAVLEASELKGLFKPQIAKSWSDRTLNTWKDS
jgi:hypothetical protein